MEGGKPGVSSSAVCRGSFLLGEGIGTTLINAFKCFVAILVLNVNERVSWNGNLISA